MASEIVAQLRVVDGLEQALTWGVKLGLFEELDVGSIERATSELEGRQAEDRELDEREDTTAVFEVTAEVAVLGIPESDMDVRLIAGNDAAEVDDFKRPGKMKEFICRRVAVRGDDVNVTGAETADAR